jgi:hypothetical protein
MASMTDFIDSINVADVPSIYNEDYSWAEEYADYYNEESDNYVQPILESSGYQFFGEASFYQEASKGLIAGGMLALLSGAFFMIMKLLKNGGSGGGSTSSSKSSSGASTKSSSKSEPAKAVARTVQHANDVQNVVSKKAEESKKNLNATFDALEAQGADVSAARKLLNGNDKPAETPKQEKPKDTLKTNKAPEEPKPEPKQEKKEYEELEAEEKIVFNSKIILDKLNEMKKKGFDEISVSDFELLTEIIKGLEEILKIASFMVSLVKENRWDVFSFEAKINHDPKDRDFEQNLSDLHYRVDRIKEHAAQVAKSDESRRHDVDIEEVKTVIDQIDKLSHAIENECKTGMKYCKIEREKLKQKNMPVRHVDYAYKILNGIIRDVNFVCKNVQTAFSTINKSLIGKKYPYPLNVRYYDLTKVGTYYDPFDDPNESYKELLTSFEKNPSKLFNRLTKALHDGCERIFYSNDNTLISDFEIKNTKSFGKDALNNNRSLIKKMIKNISIFMNNCRKDRPQYSEIFNLVEDNVRKGYELLLELFNVDPITLVGQKKSECKVGAVNNLLAYANDYLFDEKPKAMDIQDKIVDMYQSRSTKFDHNTPVTEFFENIGKTSDKIGDIDGFPANNFRRFMNAYQDTLADLKNDPSDEEEYMIKIKEAIEKYIYATDTSLSISDWQRVESWLESIGFKSLNINSGDKLDNKIKTYFMRPIPAKTDDKSKDMTVKMVQQQPRRLDIVVDGSKTIFKLAGKCTYWKYEKLVNKISETVEAKTNSLPPNTPVGKFYDDIGKNMNKLEGVLEDKYLSRFKSSYEKGLKMFNDPDEDEEDVFSEIYQSLRKNVWERQPTLSKDNLKYLIAFISSIGFKEVNISEGKKITPQDGKYFKEIFKEPTDDTSLNYTIKKIHEHPMEMNITLEGDNFNAILPGMISMYRLKG